MGYQTMRNCSTQPDWNSFQRVIKRAKLTESGLGQYGDALLVQTSLHKMRCYNGNANMKTKAKYSKPKLEKFGSVRNLTGGSVGTQMDAMGLNMFMN